MMARKCSICRKAGHNARNCPNKDAPATKANAKDKPTTTTPTGTGINAKFCGNCKNLVAGRGIATGEPYCKLNEAAVRAQWVCRKWAKGTVADIKEPKLGIDV